MVSYESKGCIGVVGGLGVGSAMHYYLKLAEAHAARGVTMNLVMAHAETAQVFQFVGSGDRTGLTQYLLSFIRRLAAAGADFVVIPAVVPHFCIEELSVVSPLPIFNIFDPLIRELSVRSLRRVALFGTHFAMNSELFGMVPGISFVRPEPEEAESIHRIYLSLVQRGKGTVEELETLTHIAKKLCSRDGVEAIVLAGTDLSPLFCDSKVEFPMVDCGALHLRAIVDHLFG